MKNTSFIIRSITKSKCLIHLQCFTDVFKVSDPFFCSITPYYVRDYIVNHFDPRWYVNS